MRSIIFFAALAAIMATRAFGAEEEYDVAARVRASGLIGEWSFNCSDRKVMREITIRRGGAALFDHLSKTSYEIVGLEWLSANTMRVSYYGPTTHGSGETALGVTHTQYEWKADALYTLDSRNEFGVSVVERGQHAADQSPFPLLLKCHGSTTPPIEAAAMSEADASRLAPNVPRAPSVDCSKPKNPAARLICSRPQLRALDSDLAVAYRQALATLPASKKSALQKEQVEWIRRRNGFCSVTHVMQECIGLAIAARIQQLRRGGAHASMTRGEHCQKGFGVKQQNGDLPANADFRRFLNWCMEQTDADVQQISRSDEAAANSAGLSIEGGQRQSAQPISTRSEINGRGVPQFKGYPALAAWNGRVTEPRLHAQNERIFRTRLRDAAREQPNFAGHYRVVTWGCGTSCEAGAIIDAHTGKVTMFPFSIWCCEQPTDDAFRRIEFRLGSRLIVFTGLRNEEGEEAAHFYTFDGAQFMYLKSVKR